MMENEQILKVPVKQVSEKSMRSCDNDRNDLVNRTQVKYSIVLASATSFRSPYPNLYSGVPYILYSTTSPG